MTGGALGSLFAQCFHLSAAERKTLLVAGAAAGMTGIFGTPVAAVLLAVELLLFEWKPRSFVPVVAAVLASFAWRPLLIGQGALFPFAGHIPGDHWALLAAAGIGLLMGLQAGLLSTLLYRIEDLFHRLPIHWMWWPALGAIVVGCGGWIEPHALGAGYANIQNLLDGSMVRDALILLLVVKAAIWLVALGSGTSGGVLAPLLIMGGALGCLAGQWLPGDHGFWALLGMAGIMSAAMRAPLTGAIFAIELTGRLDALPCSVAAAATGYAVAVLLLRRSILTERIARRGRHVVQEYGVDPLAVAQVAGIMARDPATLPADMLVADAADFFSREARYRSYPVIDGDRHPVGLVSRADVLRWDLDALPDDVTLADLVSDQSLPLAHPDMAATAVADLMLAEDVSRVPVVDGAGRIVGIVALRDLLRARLAQHREERHRERFAARPAASPVPIDA